MVLSTERKMANVRSLTAVKQQDGNLIIVITPPFEQNLKAIVLGVRSDVTPQLSRTPMLLQQTLLIAAVFSCMMQSCMPPRGTSMHFPSPKRCVAVGFLRRKWKSPRRALPGGRAQAGNLAIYG
jgi:hypothetical protein